MSNYYLRKEPHEATIESMTKLDGAFIPEREYMTDDMAIFKHHDFTRFYRGYFSGVNGKYQGMKLYTCKSMKRIMALRQTTFEYCGDMYDVYDKETGENISKKLRTIEVGVNQNV